MALLYILFFQIFNNRHFQWNDRERAVAHFAVSADKGFRKRDMFCFI